ncbi:MAG: 1-(5-phosphoribosyl)-5-[(5-phosphoribosylamino)methylideneamino]imidazole-4-carboxamide isomerase [Planctomycetota bacterium]|nr:MAG: 1-(5-phosphoribosyl)-5-[(5-phosphoribosylamino)methylideneamino]imidazole-4-carboxamide isomerase [Planctomycetota bacterium]REJ87606.1 MAG: 1-(5-phosphoribosyl)-5-[(5-phosphoribosylamino)methylideneamino]imidazole-4-carboxamide isomerase [Planctomycetota bacterium]REK30156.1 MAG: 1-(5-phosphoribosyl)-5-[(5-phosphoribosylamino)methylideneamino]imidazole-4-carboxamide isomerase [Planctomycetota bacterium]REK43317.1 MAG: 1-(5-phosphoribosyl)-5-[(5-phosphoribosylamino)methylideneamino]imida
MAFELWPAIDLRDGHCVRLSQGDFARETVYGDDPAGMARHWVEQGAERLHLVDLDAARDGHATNRSSVRAIVEAVDVPCQFGGGVRSEEVIEELLELGLARLVIGTRGVREPEWFAEMCGRFPGKLCLGIDALDGRVATDGWQSTSETMAVELAKRVNNLPLAAIVYTDIARDGTLAGPNLAALREMAAAVEVPVIASGGVRAAEDIAAVAALASEGLSIAGCIVGKALYEQRVTLAAALAAAGDPSLEIS